MLLSLLLLLLFLLFLLFYSVVGVAKTSSFLYNGDREEFIRGGVESVAL